MKHSNKLAAPLCLIIAGASSVLAFAPFRCYWLIFFSLAVLVFAVRRQPQRAFFYGWLWGLSSYSANFYWVYYSLHDIAGLTAWLAIPLVFLLPASLALYTALAMWLTCRLSRQRHDLYRWLLIFPASWTLSEWLRGWFLTGFSWGEIGYSQIIESPLAGFAPIFGIHSVTLIVALFSSILALFLFAKLLCKQTKVCGALAFLVVLLFIFAAWSKQYSWTTPIGSPLKVALAQGNIAQSIKWSPEAFDDTLHIYYQQVNSTNADIMILPEAALPALLDEIPANYLDLLKQSAQKHHMALALGVPIREQNHLVNAVLNLTNPTQEYYAKQHLVPFGEYVPLPILTGWLYQHMNMPMSNFSSGVDHHKTLTMRGQKIAFNICYEDGFGDEIIKLARHSTILANVSNLAWFGKSTAMYQHLQLSQARSLETGRYMLRSTNTGMTAIIDAYGNIIALAEPNTQQVLIGEVTGRQGITPYMYWGNWPIILLATLLLLSSQLSLLKLGLKQTKLNRKNFEDIK